MKKKASSNIKGNNNVVNQNSTINNFIIDKTPAQYVDMLSEAKNYDAIRSSFVEYMKAINHIRHPLYPYYEVIQMKGDIQKLISSPTTEKALSLYPKRIKTSFTIDTQKYPYYHEGEAPWDYAYRTQEPIILNTKEYKEYLGEIEDPFPIEEFSDGMLLQITASPFPPAQSVIMQSGNVKIELLLARKPIKEYNKMLLESEKLKGEAISITIRINTSNNDSDFTLNKLNEASLEKKLEVELLYKEMITTKKLSIVSNNKIIFESNITDKNIKQMSNNDSYIKYLKNLITLQKHFSCNFKISLKTVSEDDYIISCVMARSLDNEWYNHYKKYDSFRVAYDAIHESVFAKLNNGERNIDGLTRESNDVKLSLAGVNFTCKKYSIRFFHGIINNYQSVIKGLEKKRKMIMITIKPIKENEYYTKSENIAGLKLDDEISLC